MAPMLKSAVSEIKKQVIPMAKKNAPAMVKGASRAYTKIAKLIGRGDYEISDTPEANALFPKAKSPSPYATFANDGSTVIVEHREYIKDVFTGPSAGTFNIESIPVQPGLVSSFPYLAAIAANYEEYSVQGLVFEFISTTSPYTT
jgi:hypothetical protein